MIDERLHAQVRVPLEIFPHTVEDYDRIVNRNSEDRQKRCDKQAIDFNSQKMTKRQERIAELTLSFINHYRKDLEALAKK